MQSSSCPLGSGLDDTPPFTDCLPHIPSHAPIGVSWDPLSNKLFALKSLSLSQLLGEPESRQYPAELLYFLIFGVGQVRKGCWGQIPGLVQG